MKNLIILIILLSAEITFATDYFVDGNTVHSGNGTKSFSFKTIQEAANIMKPGDVCMNEKMMLEESCSNVGLYQNQKCI